MRFQHCGDAGQFLTGWVGRPASQDVVDERPSDTGSFGDVQRLHVKFLHAGAHAVGQGLGHGGSSNLYFSIK
jgi:hypothetical protein